MKKSLVVIFLLLGLTNNNLLAQQVNKTARAGKEVENNSAVIKNHVIIRFGNDHHIDYNLKTGTADIYFKHLKIISAAYAAVKDLDQYYTSKGEHTVTFIKTAFIDSIGKGMSYTMEIKKEGSPLMSQVFYTYADKDYFLTEVSLEGENLRSNYMAPLISNAVDIFANGDNRVLFVPFDNDTFISYNAKSMSSTVINTSAEVTAFYENESRRGLVIGSVEHTNWKTGIRTIGTGSKCSQLAAWGGYTEAAVTRDSIPHGFIAGNFIKSPKIFVGYFSDWRNGLEEYGKANRKVERPYVFNWTKPTPFGWNSWGAIQSDISYKKAIAVANFFSDSLPVFRNDHTAFIDLDSYWDKFLKGGITGDINELTQFADYCKSKGLQPGIYWAPFADWGWKRAGSEARKVEGGGDYTYGDIWTKTNGHYHNIDGARAIDPTHPGTRQRIALFISKFKACGFKMIKVDFIGHASIEADSFYDKSVTTGMQAFKKGMEYLVDQLGSQFLIYAAISPGMATGRYVHTRRIACDAFKTIKDTRYTLNSVNYGWWQTYVYNYIDADHIVFGKEPEGANRARLASGLITGTLITGDDYSINGPWSDRAKNLLQNNELLTIAANGKAFKPVDGNNGDTTNQLFQQVIEGYLYLTVFNYADNKKNYAINLSRVGLNPLISYDATELFRNSPCKVKDILNISLEGGDAAIYKFKLNNTPVINEQHKK